MAKVVFTPNIQRHVALPQMEASGRTVRDVLDAVLRIIRRRAAMCSTTNRHCAST
ncbi:MAG TPA: hypothetical protein VFI58_14785 [Xanthobacteraceae bacterium]|jgi:hypothetical protein|nr:hypothetical protein [Xanthobacteraceae bacterium]